MRRPFFLACVLSFAVMLILSMDTLPTYLVRLKEDYVTLWAGGDLVVKSPFEINIPQDLIDDQVVVAESLKLSTMMRIDEKAYLIHLQLVSPSYPLYGQLSESGETVSPTNGVMVSRSLMNLAKLSLGDQVSIGDQVYTVSGAVDRQDEQVYDFDAFSPSVFMSYDQKDRLGLITPTARYHHYIYIKAATDYIVQLKEKLNVLLPSTSKLIVPQQSLGRIERIYNQVVNVLDAVKIMGYLLVGSLLYLATEYYQRRLLREIGVLKVIGYSFRQRLWYFTKPLVGLCAIGYVMGGVVGGLGLFLLLLYTDSTYLDQLPYGWILWRCGSVYVAFLCLILPIRALATTRMSTDQLLRAKHQTNYMFILLLGITFIALILSITQWSLLTLMNLMSLVVVFVCGGGLLIFGLLSIVNSLFSLGNQRFLLSLNGLRLYQQEHTFTIMFMTLILSVCISIWHIGFQTVPSWSADLPQDAANTFIVGIQEEQLPALYEQFNWLADANLYPVVKGRLLNINSQDVFEYQNGIYTEHEAFNRQINLTTVSKLPDRNLIIEGDWADQGISADSGIMRRLGLKLGDRLTFQLYGDEITLPITSIREVDWQSMRANFYFIFPQGVIDEYPKSYMTSVYWTDVEAKKLYNFSEVSPSSTVISVDGFIRQARDFTAKVTRLSYVLLTIVAAFSTVSLVFIMLNQMSQRQEQMSVMTYLGYDPNHNPVILIEMMLMATLSSVMSVIVSYWAIDRFNRSIGLSWYIDQSSIIFIILLYLMIMLLSRYFQRTILSRLS